VFIYLIKLIDTKLMLAFTSPTITHTCKQFIIQRGYVHVLCLKNQLVLCCSSAMFVVSFLACPHVATTKTTKQQFTIYHCNTPLLARDQRVYNHICSFTVTFEGGCCRGLFNHWQSMICCIDKATVGMVYLNFRSNENQLTITYRLVSNKVALIKYFRTI